MPFDSEKLDARELALGFNYSICIYELTKHLGKPPKMADVEYVFGRKHTVEETTTAREFVEKKKILKKITYLECNGLKTWRRSRSQDSMSFS